MTFAWLIEGPDELRFEMHRDILGIYYIRVVRKHTMQVVEDDRQAREFAAPPVQHSRKRPRESESRIAECAICIDAYPNVHSSHAGI